MSATDPRPIRQTPQGPQKRPTAPRPSTERDPTTPSTVEQRKRRDGALERR